MYKVLELLNTLIYDLLYEELFELEEVFAKGRHLPSLLFFLPP
jgi:hypothetical protein